MVLLFENKKSFLNLLMKPGKLSLQEKEDYNWFETYKIPAYLGYRSSFKEGFKRKDYKNKPIFALLEVS